MAAKFKTLPRGTKVHYVYRGNKHAEGTVTGVHKMGTTHANTEYSIRPHHPYPGESSTVFHYGRILHVGW